MNTLPTPVRWVSCSLEVNTQVARNRHLVVPGTVTTLCGHSATHPDIWRGSSAKPECKTCLKVYADGGYVIPTARTPYGTKGSGHSGSVTSRERQQREDADGTTGWRQTQVLQRLALRREYGRTCHELEAELGAGHGAVSAALSVLHRDGTIARITERRNRQEIYVLPEFVLDREVSPFRPRFNVNRLGRAEVGMLEDAANAAMVKELDNRNRTRSMASVAVEAVLDAIREMTP